MKTLSIFSIFALVSVGCATASPPPVAPVQQESVASNEAWHPQEDGFEMPEVAPAKQREQAPIGSLAPSRHTPTGGQLVNLATKK
jgi:hypothetical protein